MSRPTLLAFAVSEERLSRLRFCCLSLGITVKPVAPEDYAQPIGALLGIMERADAAPEPGPVGEMLVMTAFDDLLVHRFLAALKQLRIPPFRLKAMLTPTNVTWNACRLYAELSAEHAAIGQAHTPQRLKRRFLTQLQIFIIYMGMPLSFHAICCII